MFRNYAFKPGVPNVHLDELRFCVHILGFAAGQVVDDDNVMPRLDIRVNDVRTDEAGTACHEDLHRKAC